MAKKAKKTEVKDGMDLVLEGKVFIVTTENGKVTKEPLDGTLVLECVLAALKKGLKK